MKFLKSVTLIMAFFFAFSADAKLKGLPFIKSYKDYNLSKKNVAYIKYNVYSPIQQGDNVVPGEPADFTAEMFFDGNGNKVKEVVYHIATGKVDLTTIWVYNEKEGTVVQTRTDEKGEFLSRTESFVDFKGHKVLSRTYENITDPITKEDFPNVLRYEDSWVEDTKKKTASFKRTHFNHKDKVAERQTIKEFPVSKPYSLYTVIFDAVAPIDYTWLPDYSDKALKATSKNTRNEQIFDGTKYKYVLKKKLLNKIEQYDPDGKQELMTDYVYTLDKQKNWSQVIQYENNNPKYIVVRDIKYN